MKEIAPGYKPTTIGHEALPEVLGKRMLAVGFAGLEVLTDSAELHSQLAVVRADDDTTDNEHIGTLCYSTRTQLPLHTAAGEALRMPSKTHPGDVYTTPSLRNFYFRGNNKLGTLASMAYGIRAFHSIEQQRLGLHSSLLFDQEKLDTTLILGRNHAGKSTIGQAIEDAGDRFVMLADDWNEVSVTNGTITPVSKIFSPPVPNSRYEYAFTSFGKSFYHKRLPANLPPLQLGRVIELHDGDETADPDSFILRNLTHIPFIRQPVGESTLACPCLEHLVAIHTVVDRKKAIIDGYRTVTQQVLTMAIENNPAKNSIEEVTAKIQEVLE